MGLRGLSQLRGFSTQSIEIGAELGALVGLFNGGPLSQLLMSPSHGMAVGALGAVGAALGSGGLTVGVTVGALVG